MIVQRSCGIVLLAIVTLPAIAVAQGFDASVSAFVGVSCAAFAPGANPFGEQTNDTDFTPAGSPSANGQATCQASRMGDGDVAASSDAFGQYSGTIASAGTDVFGNALVSSITLTVNGTANASASGAAINTASNGLSNPSVRAGFRVLPGTTVIVEVTQSGTFATKIIRGGGALPIDLAGGFAGVVTESSGGVELAFTGGAGARVTPPQPAMFNGNITMTITFGPKPPQGACCRGPGLCSDARLQSDCDGTFLGDQVLCSAGGCPGVPTPTPTATPDALVIDWVNGAGGDFGVPDNWDPAAVPDETQIARFQLPDSYFVTGAAGRVRRLVVAGGNVLLDGGFLELLELSLAAPSAAIGGLLDLLGGGTVRSSHVSVGTGAGLESALAVSGANTRWESSGRVTVGDASVGFLFVNDGSTLESAESRIGESATGEAVVEGEDSSWTTGNIAVGKGAEGNLRIDAGARVSSGEGVVGLTGSGFGFVEVLGTGAPELASTWQLQALRVGAGGLGSLRIADGGNVSVVLMAVGGELPGSVAVVTKPSVLDASQLVVGGSLGGDVNVSAGGRVITLDTQLGPGAGEGDVTVNLSGDGNPNAVDHYEFTALTLSVRRGTLRISDHGSVLSESAVVAGPAANVVVSGNSAGWEVTDSLQIGSSAEAGTVTLELGNLLIGPGGMIITTFGTLAGSGLVIFSGGPGSLPLDVTSLGTISPDIVVFDPPELRPFTARAGGLGPVALVGAEELVIDGNLTLGAPAVLRIPVADPETFGILHVTGAATLAGTLELRFVDGFLPTAGTAFEMLQVDGAANGGFDRIVVRGVSEDLPFATSVVDGDLTFTALADAKACGSGDGNGDGLADCERCDDCVDDDGDGLVDRADPDCAPAADGAGLGIGGDAAARKALGKCAATMAAVGAKLSALVATHLQKCTDAVLACVQTKLSDTACLAKAKATCVKATAGLAPDGSDRRKARLTIAKACSAKTPGAPPTVPLATVVAATGLGFDAEVARCAALATPALASVDDVIACIGRATVCRASALFATRVPRAFALLSAGVGGANVPPCLPPSAEEAGALGDPKSVGKPLTKCQKALAAAGAKLAARLTKGYGACAAAMRTCVQSTDSTACLTKATASCGKATRTLPTVGGAADAKLLAALTKACGTVDVAALLDAKGLGFATAGARCAGLGVATVDGPAALATCLSREHACAAATLVEATTPRLRELLGHAGVALD